MWLVESERFNFTLEKSSLAAKPAMAACVNPAFIFGVATARKELKINIKPAKC